MIVKIEGFADIYIHLTMTWQTRLELALQTIQGRLCVKKSEAVWVAGRLVDTCIRIDIMQADQNTVDLLWILPWLSYFHVVDEDDVITHRFLDMEQCLMYVEQCAQSAAEDPIIEPVGFEM